MVIEKYGLPPKISVKLEAIGDWVFLKESES